MTRIINAENLVLGKVATLVAELALKKERVDIVNIEKIIITGKKEYIVGKYTTRTKLHLKGNPTKGPKFPRTTEGIVRRAIRGMLPWKTQRGRDAFKRIKVHNGIPIKFEGMNDKFETIEKAKADLKRRHLTIKDLSLALGHKGE